MALNDIPKRPKVEPTIEEGWVDNQNTFLRVRPPLWMDDVFAEMRGVVPATRYVWPPTSVIVRENTDEHSEPLRRD